jgi:crotonobetainyl-CoA:carnitine CoA-transferase CaiB-like acyl-CoA transferase
VTTVNRELPLAGVRVVELAGGRAELCGRLLADLGAQVVFVEPVGGVGSRRVGQLVAGESVSFAAFNAGKVFLEADLSTVAGRARVMDLVEGADVVIDSRASAVDLVLGPDELADRFPGLVVVSVSDFGRSGPYRGFRGSSAVLAALGGVLSRSGLPDRAPVLPPGDLVMQTAAVQAVWCGLLALWNRNHTGVGDLLDVSLHETVAQILDPAVSMTGRSGFEGTSITLPWGRPDEGHRYPIFVCADGRVRICVLAPRQWHALRSWLGDPLELMDPALDATGVRLARWQEILPRVAELFATASAAELVAQGQARGVPVEALASISDVMGDEHFLARGAFTEVTVGKTTGRVPSGFYEIDGHRVGPVTTTTTTSAPRAESWWFPRVSVPPAQASVPRRPLAGLRVLDLGVIVAGAELGRLFASQGADVIKIENTEFPDGSRHSAWGDTMSPSFASGHRGKRSVGINLRSEVGRELLLGLVAHADLLFSNFKPGTLEKLGLSNASLLAINPRLVVVDSSALGATGPRARSMGYGPLVRAATALTSQWRDPDLDDGYCDAVTIFPDHFVARICAIGALATLLRRDRTGHGGTVSVSQAESILNVLPEMFLAQSLATNGATLTDPDHTDLVLRCAEEDNWTVLTLTGDTDWEHLAAHLNSNHDTDREQLVAQLRDWAADRTHHQVMTTLQGAGLAAGAMVRPQEYRNDPQLQAREFIVELDQPGLPAPLPVENSPCHSRHMPDPELIPAPFMFAHTHEIAHDVLGLDEATITQLTTTGALEIARSVDDDPFPLGDNQ